MQEEVRRLEELRVTEKEELPAKVRGVADTLPETHRLCYEGSGPLRGARRAAKCSDMHDRDLTLTFWDMIAQYQ